MPPSPVVMVLVPWKENAPNAPIEPAALPRHCEPMASAASSMTGNTVLTADRQQRVHVTQIAVQMHRQMALVRGVMALPHLLRIQAPAVRQHVDEHRRSAQVSRSAPPKRSSWYWPGSLHRPRRCPVPPSPCAARRCNWTSRWHTVTPMCSANACFETRDVFVAALAPAILHGIQHVPGFQFTDTRFGVVNSAHLNTQLRNGNDKTCAPRCGRPANCWVISSSRFHGSTST